MNGFRQGLVAIILALNIGTANAADTHILTARQAYDKARTGEVLLIDVRSPQEWRQTGVPAGGIAETVHRDGGLAAFAKAVLAKLHGDRSQPVAVICARGGRSAAAAAYLKSEGFSNVADVAEGMTGGPHGAGWQSQDLPTTPWNKR